MEPEEREARRMVLKSAIRYLEEGREEAVGQSFICTTIWCTVTDISWRT